MPEDIAARVARARMLPSAERDKAMKQIKDEFKLDSVEQATALVDAIEHAIALDDGADGGAEGGEGGVGDGEGAAFRLRRGD